MRRIHSLRLEEMIVSIFCIVVNVIEWTVFVLLVLVVRMAKGKREISCSRIASSSILVREGKARSVIVSRIYYALVPGTCTTTVVQICPYYSLFPPMVLEV